MSLPVLISVPHGGLTVPPEVRDLCVLTPRQIVEDGDEGAAEIYSDLERHVQAFVATDVARAIVDQNRAEDDRRADGVIKTHTCLDVPVYASFPDDDCIEALLARYHRPYHRRLREQAASVMVGFDCHTMLAVGPAMGPMAGQERPAVCLSNVDGTTCPDAWLELMAECLEAELGVKVARNSPFKGGHIIRSHAVELPWMQLELSRAPFLTNGEKRRRVHAAMERFCDRMARS